MIHKIQLTNYAVRLVSESSDLQLGTQNSYGNEQLQLILSSEWKGLTITATFYAPGVSKGTRVLADADGLIAVPPEATAGIWTIQPGRIVFTGITDGIQRISQDLLYTVINHSEIEGEESKTTPSVLDQAIAQTGAARDKAVSAASEAEMSASKAEDKAKAAEQAQLAAEIASEYVENVSQNIESNFVAIELAQTETINIVSNAKKETVADISAVKEKAIKVLDDTKTISINSIQEAQHTAEASITDKHKSAAASLKAIQSSSEQAIENTTDEAIKSVTDEGKTQVEKLKNLVSNIYTKFESDSRFAPISAAICPTVSGNPAVCKDSIEWNFQGFKIYGKSVQEGIPTLNKHVPIVNAGVSGSVELNITNGTTQSQSLIITTPNGLSGIPVTDGGNYIDTTGQQWICDEVDVQSGFLIQRCGMYTISEATQIVKSGLSSDEIGFYSISNLNIKQGNKREKANVMSNCFVATMNQGFNNSSQVFLGGSLTNSLYFTLPSDIAPDANAAKQFAISEKFTFLYILETPIVVPLSAEELSVYRSLNAYAGTTIVSTPESVAGIEINYIMDGAAFANKVLTALR